MNQSEYSLVDSAKLLWAKRKLIMLVVAGVSVVTSVVSLLMPNYYTSDTIFYAASPDLADPIPIGGQDKNIRIFGDDTDLDRLFTIASSYELQTFIIDSFDLYKHYDIDVSDAKAKFKVMEKFRKNFKTIKTKYRALHLSIEDEDPKMAADMVNAARDKISDIAQKIVKGSQERLIKNYESNILKKQARNDTLSAMILKMKTLNGIMNVQSQAEIYTSIITRTEAELEVEKGKFDYFSAKKLNRDSINKYASVVLGLENKLAQAKQKQEVYNANVAPIIQMEQEMFRNLDQLNLDKERYKQLTATFDAPFTALHLVEQGQVPVQKSRPKRSIWVIIAAFMTMVCFSLYLVMQEVYYRDHH